MGVNFHICMFISCFSSYERKRPLSSILSNIMIICLEVSEMFYGVWTIPVGFLYSSYS